ncbi:DoxX family protein [Frigoriflavimonas asaccharolytica]|uniref:Putative oxidoreductase n=1 Tax=Frigoriflavimonas asaccharolytica TaxID=2735899 RepID=A0A8J8G5K9_9FLAO|nr:DoxX family protein [Frigoriflavimonas asaccharolytica]NRS91553.1 putative oxidoreductase [Frigoriflavimonas asaccharolytica]
MIQSSKKFFIFFQNSILLIVRMLVGLAMLSHGFPKLQTLINGGKIEFYNFLGLSSTISLGLTVFSEFVCSIFLILGLFSRYAAFFLAFTMIIAAFVFHGGDPWEKQEMSIIYLCSYFLLLAFGAGKFSIDSLIDKRKSTKIY